MKRTFSIAAALLVTIANPAGAITGYSPADGTRAEFNFRVGADLVRHGRYDEGVPYLDKALDQWPDDTDVLAYEAMAHRALAATASGTARSAEQWLAAAYYRRILVQDLNQRDFLEYMGEMYLSLDDPAAANSELTALQNACPRGCEQRKRLAASIKAYMPPPPPQAPPVTPEPTH